MNKILSPIIFGIFIAFFISPFVLAQINFDVEANDIYLSPGNFTLKLTSDIEKTDDFGITVLGSYRNWVYFDQDYITLYPGKTKEIKFNIESPENCDAGVYSIPVFVYSLTNESISSRKEIRVLIEKNYGASLRAIETNKKSFDPGDTIKIKGKVLNTGNEDFKEIVLAYELFKGEKMLETYTNVFSLEKGEEKPFEKDIEIEKNMPAGDYTVKIYLTYKNEVLDKNTLNINVKEFGKIEKQVHSSWTPVGEFGRIEVTNIGNVKKTEKITMEIKRPWDIFLTSSMKGTKEYKNDIALYVWEVTLDVGEKTDIDYQIHYWPLIIISLLVIYGGYWTFKTSRRPKINKNAVNIMELEDDRKEIMVSLEIKNIGEDLEDVLIEDFIPPVAKLIKDFKTIKPKISKTENGTKLTWNLKKLKKHEDRILTYKMETLVGTLDYLKLPKARLTAKIGERNIKANSSALRIEEEK